MDAGDKANADTYIALMRKAIDKGDSWMATEKARIDRMLGSGNLNAGKIEEMSIKASILSAFLPEDS